MARTRLLVVYDTNVYVDDFEPDFDARLRAETKRGVRGMATYWVAAELLFRYVTARSEAETRRREAVERFWLHCVRDLQEIKAVEFLGGADDHVCQALFGRTPTSRSIDAAVVGHLIGRVANSRNRSDVCDILPQLEDVANAVREYESQFVKHVLHGVDFLRRRAAARTKSQSPHELRKTLKALVRAPETLQLIAGAHVERCGATLGIDLSDEKRASLAAKYAETFPMPLNFYRFVLEMVAVEGWNLLNPRRANSAWDHQFLFATSVGAYAHSAPGAPIWLITGDNDMHKGAGDSDSTAMLLRSCEYAELVTAKPKIFSAALRRRSHLPASRKFKR
jgi:hypothetical protein